MFCILLLMPNFLWAGKFEKVQKKFNIDTNDELLVYIEIDAGEITISHNKKASEIKVTGRINEKYDELDMGYDNRHNEFSITLDRKKWFKSVTNENASEIEVELPGNVVLNLNSKVKAGTIAFQLGGLSIKNFGLRNKK